MKRKLTLLLSLVLIFTSVGFLGSCKDYDEDRYTDLNHRLNDLNLSLKDYISVQLDVLKGQIDKLEKAQKECQENCSTKLAQLDVEIINLKTAVDNKADKAVVEALKTKVDNLVVEIATLQTTVQELKTKITEIQTLYANLEPRVKANEDNITVLQTMFGTLNSTVVQLKATVIDILTKLPKIEENANAITALGTVVDNLKTELNTKINEVKEKAESALAKANSNYTFMENVKNLVDNLRTEYNAYTLKTDADIQQLTSDLVSCQTECQDIRNELADVEADLLAKIQNNTTSIADLITKYTDLVAADAELSTKLSKLETDVNANTKAISDLEDTVNTLTGRVNAIVNALNSMITGILVQGTNNPVFGTFAMPTNSRTNVLIAFMGKSNQDFTFPTQATGNYVYPTQVLTAEEVSMIGSGIMNSVNYPGGCTLLSDAEDNAGTIYVTINPTGKNFTGAELTLENSQMKQSGVKLSPLAESNALLTFGYTRTAANGFYEAKAKVTQADIDMGNVQLFNFDTEGFKSIIKDLMNRGGFNSTNAALTVYNQLNGFLDANAATASYLDVDGNKRNVYSQYNVAATAIKPLSYSTGQAFYGKSTLPGYEQAEALIDRIANTLNSKIKNALKKVYDNGMAKWKSLRPNMKKLAVVQIKSATHEVVFNVTFKASWQDISGTTYHFGMNGTKLAIYDSTNKLITDLNSSESGMSSWTLNSDGTVTATVTDNALYNYLSTSIMSVNELNKALNKFIDDVNSMLESYKYESLVDKSSNYVAATLKKILDMINKRGIAFVNQAVLRMQPCMLVSTPAGTYMGINSVAAPVVSKSTDITLIPTSYTAEILTPAFKKHVACVNVLKDGESAQAGNAECKAALDAVNSQAMMNKVIDGNIRSIALTNLKSGYSYQFAYSAVDYHGKICTKRVVVLVQ